MENNDDKRVILIRIIDSLAKLYGIKRMELADIAGVTPTTMTHFLQGKSSSALSINQLEKVLEAVHVDLSPYLYRLELAKEISKYLLEVKKKSVEEVIKWDRATFKKETEREELDLFPDYDINEFSNAYSRKLVDLQSCWPSFKALVINNMKINSLGEMTPAVVKAANNKLSEEVGMKDKPLQVSKVTNKNPEQGNTLGMIIGGVAGVVVALAACFLLNDDK